MCANLQTDVPGGEVNGKVHFLMERKMAPTKSYIYGLYDKLSFSECLKMNISIVWAKRRKKKRFQYPFLENSVKAALLKLLSASSFRHIYL